MTRYTPCPDWEPRLSAYQDGEATPRERQLVEAHLAGCEACRRALAQFAADRAAFTGAYAGAYPDMTATVLQEVRAMTQQPNQTTIPTAWLRWAVGFGAAAVLVTLALVVAIFTSPRETPVMVYAPGANGETEASYGYDGSLLRNINGTDLPYKPYYDKKEAPKRLIARDPFAVASPSPSLTFTGRRSGQANFAGDLSGASDFLYNPTTDRNYGINGGLKMVYDIGYGLQVKNALKAARDGSALIRRHGGFVIDFAYSGDEGQIPAATVRGKVPAKEAKATLAALEKMGRVTGITLNGEDLTPQFLQYMEEMEKKIKTAEKLGNIRDSNRYWETLSAEQARHWAEQQAAQNKRAMLDVVTKSSLVEITATFAENSPQETFGLPQFLQLMRSILIILLVVLAVVATLFVLLALFIAPIILLRRRSAPLQPQTAPLEPAE